MDRILIRKDSYYDSVFLMSLSAELGRSAGLEAGHVVLATPANRELLAGQGFDPAPLAALGPTDLVIALRGPDAATLDSAAARLDELLSPKRGGAQHAAAERPIGLAGGLAQLPGANLALISVPGQYAAYEAAKALEQGLHVMIFSDNVPVEEEVALKRSATTRGLLVMGPDCGTALISGKPLGFANRVRTGPIGLVGASGTGLQEVSCQIHRLGCGVSHILGTGGRDLSAKVGGLTALAALGILAADPATRVLVLVSKPPEPKVAARLLGRLATLGKPAVAVFLGDEKREEPAGVRLAQDLSQAAWMACALAADGPPTPPEEKVPAPVTDELVARMTPTQRHLHGLFCGGTLGAEALLLLRGQLEEIHSNLDHAAGPLPAGHSVIDLGDDEFTRGRPHPMIEPALRAEWIVRLGADPATAVVLLDCVLGAGSHPDPAGVTAAAVLEARRRNPGLAVIGSVTGTDLDAQGLSRQQAILREAGVHVLPSNIAAAAAAARVAKALGRR